MRSSGVPGRGGAPRPRLVDVVPAPGEAGLEPSVVKEDFLAPAPDEPGPADAAEGAGLGDAAESLLSARGIFFPRGTQSDGDVGDVGEGGKDARKAFGVPEFRTQSSGPPLPRSRSEGGGRTRGGFPTRRPTGPDQPGSSSPSAPGFPRPSAPSAAGWQYECPFARPGGSRDSPAVFCRSVRPSRKSVGPPAASVGITFPWARPPAAAFFNSRVNSLLGPFNLDLNFFKLHISSKERDKYLEQVKIWQQIKFKYRNNKKNRDNFYHSLG
jgi:hypothetical protein